MALSNGAYFVPFLTVGEREKDHYSDELSRCSPNLLASDFFCSPFFPLHEANFAEAKIPRPFPRDCKSSNLNLILLLGKQSAGACGHFGIFIAPQREKSRRMQVLRPL